MRKSVWLTVASLILLAGVAIVLRVRAVARDAAPAPSETPVDTHLASLEVAESAYDSKLGPGWTDWGWGPHEQPTSGPVKVVFAGYGGIVLKHAELRGSYGGVTFRFKAPPAWKDFLAVGLRLTGTSDSVFPIINIDSRYSTPLPDGWRQVFVPSSLLNPANLAIDRIAITARVSVSTDWVLLDKVALTKPLGGQVVSAPMREVDLKVNCDGAVRAISPLIYGGAAGDWESGQTAERIGGNLTSRLNWDAGFWNTGNDWFFENYAVDGSIWQWLEANARRGKPAAVTVPMLGWVAKDASSVGFPKQKFPKQRKFDEHRPDAGDGHLPDGAPIKPGSAEQTSIAAPPQMIGRWVKSLREKDAARGGSRSAMMYILDNEPSLWNSTHRDVRPEPLGYDELLQRTIEYSTEVRKADPDALIAGPAEWGWSGYFYSGKDQAGDIGLRPDRRAHGDVPLVAWYLRKLAEHDKQTGARSLDVLDVHFYPAAPNLYGANARVDAEGADLRIRATRALWDPYYKDESWIGEPVELIPRLQRWVAENYPGRKVSLGEWSFGADEHISGALATVEALGRFGQQGLDAAFYWNGPKKNTGTFWAFRAFRNFDEKGARFLDLSVPTRDADKVSIFASRDESKTHLVAIVVNRDASFAVNAKVNMTSCGRPTSRRVFKYAAGSSKLEEVRTTGVDPRSALVLQPYSFAVLDLQVE